MILIIPDQLPRKTTDRRQGIFDLMGNLCHDLSKGSQTLGLGYLLLKGFCFAQIPDNTGKNQSALDFCD